jgi:signal transduction histidine kinase
VATRDDLHVLLVTPTGRDADLIAQVLEAFDVQSEMLSDVASVVDEFRAKDVGAMLIAEEALEDDKAIALLSSALSEQPAWSDLPVLILTKGGKENLQSRREQRRREPLGDVTLLERPIRIPTLISSVKAALRARGNQYVRRSAEAVLRQNEKLAAVGRVASSIAHEINNPLEAVTNCLYLLNGTPLNEEQRGYLDLAQRELARVSEISSHTLTFNRQRDIKGKASMSTLLDSVVTLYQGRLATSGICVERRYRDGRPLICRPGELRQVFVNLFCNAFDATRNGGRIVLRERSSTDSRTGQPGVLITVADTGLGVEARLKANLFDAFRSTKGINGSGLGLWISKGIIEKHRGSIRFRSSTKPGSSGTVFQVFIPDEGSPTVEAHTAARGRVDVVL